MVQINISKRDDILIVFFSGDHVQTRPAMVRGDSSVLGGPARRQRLLQLPDEPSHRRRKRHLGSQCNETSCKVGLSFIWDDCLRCDDN